MAQPAWREPERRVLTRASSTRDDWQYAMNNRNMNEMIAAYVTEMYTCKVVNTSDGVRNLAVVGDPQVAKVRLEENADPIDQCVPLTSNRVHKHLRHAFESRCARPRFSPSNARTLGLHDLKRLVRTGAATLV